MVSDNALASPNHMVWELFQALRRHCFRLHQYPGSEAETRQDAAVAVILAVQCVEVFLNIFFRVLVSEPSYSDAELRICRDLKNPRFGLDRKIKEWPLAVLGRRLELGLGIGQRFVALKDTRHRLMHFTSSHQTISIPGVEIHGLADISVYSELSVETALEALRTAEDFLCEVFMLRGITEDNLPHAMHSWTGQPPT
ncbi:MAG: hypothetical protein U1D69_04880 [Polynucleobacter sp.]|nr:hypothetical protein [Polynucleobacter sp.]